VALVAAGFLLSTAFEAYVRAQLDEQLATHIEVLEGLAEIGPEGELHLVRPFSDTRFMRPYSGWYWQITEPGHDSLRSRSLWDVELITQSSSAAFDLRFHTHEGPDGQELWVAEQDLLLPEVAGSNRVLRFMVGADLAPLEADVSRFNRQLIPALGAMLALLVMIFGGQLIYGLRPLGDLRRDVTDVRRGRKMRLDAVVGDDLLPLESEINRLLDHNEALVTRARTHVGNLAHGLKTPVAVLRNELEHLPEDQQRRMVRQLEAMDQLITRHLRRAQVAGTRSGPGVVLAERVEKLGATMNKLYPDKQLNWVYDVPDDLRFAGDVADLDEILGNLLENAAKWAISEVCIYAAKLDDRLMRVAISDDGPGVPDAERVNLFQRGRRLDEQTPGTGLGLSIVQDIVDLLGGDVRLDQSMKGGLLVKLHLPRSS